MKRGGKRVGAGRKPGSGWNEKVKAFRSDVVTKQHAIVESPNDPLSTVASWILDPALEMEFRLSAANVALPYLYPRLSASSVDARVSVATVDSTDLLKRLDERLARLAQPQHVEPLTIDQPPAITIIPKDESNSE